MRSDSVVEVTGLTKRYSPEVLALDNVSLKIAPGQILGLLGPNGAGKTTLIRLLVGLIHPTAGAAALFGEQVRPGHPVLRKVGAIVEGPGFLPHLSGLKNLEYFWRAGGQPLAEANLAGALEIAGLGDAIHRKVRTYSKGMQQRLALAQSLLGRPDLLILDEPTVGLDPQEMKDVRGLIRSTAETGRTVLLSSHILGEVEQVCTHIAVLDRGKLIRSGTVDNLLHTATGVYLEVDNVPAALRLLGSMPGVKSATEEPPGIVVQLDGLQRKQLVAALVRADIGIESVGSRNRLEDAFFQVLESDA